MIARRVAPHSGVGSCDVRRVRGIARRLPLVIGVLTGLAAPSPGVSAAAVPRPYGIYVLNEASNGRPAIRAYATGLTTSPAYVSHVTGHAIFVPIGKILLPVGTWGQFAWNWAYLDTLVHTALANGKLFSIELETGAQMSSTSWTQALPSGFTSQCGAGCAPLYDVWLSGGSSGSCSSSFVLLPWVPQVQQFWTLAADSLAAHLRGIGAYPSLRLVHVPGLSVYDEELRLPTGYPSPSTADTLPCPDGRPAYPTVLSDADTTRWKGYGYSDSAVVDGFKVIASAFAQAFPDRVLGLSLFPGLAHAHDFPNLTADTAGTVASRIVHEVSALAPGRVQLQSDDLDVGAAFPYVITYSSDYATATGWQSNKRSGTGAACNGGPCGPDAPDSPYYQLLQTGSVNLGTYFEAWSADVVSYPLSIAEADSAGFYGLASVPIGPPGTAPGLELGPLRPNPCRGAATVSYRLAAPGDVDLAVFSVQGRRVRTLARGTQDAGPHTALFQGFGLPAGQYYCRLASEGATRTVKVLLVR